MVIKNYAYLIFYFFLFATACKPVQHISKTDIYYTIVRSESAPQEDEQVKSLVAPYKAQLDAVMNEVLGDVQVELVKQKPEGTLGNWVADVIVERLRKDGYEVDFSIVNYGGLRVPYISQGPLTRGEIFELSPFDNTLFILDVPGAKLDSAFLLIAEAEGWPVSHGVKLVISHKKVISAKIHDQPLDANRIYKVATLDYVANGGDNMKMFIPLIRKQTGLILRDVLIEYAKGTKDTGTKITSLVEGRVINQ